MGNSDMIPAFLQTNDIGKLIHTVRGQQVMLDSDLAMLYGYGVKTLNQQV